jgi:hypothetical protein
VNVEVSLPVEDVIVVIVEIVDIVEAEVELLLLLLLQLLPLQLNKFDNKQVNKTNTQKLIQQV